MLPGPSARAREPASRACSSSTPGSSRLCDASSCWLQRRTWRARKPSGRPKSPSPTAAGSTRCSVGQGVDHPLGDRAGALAAQRLQLGARPVGRALDALHDVERRADDRRRPGTGRYVSGTGTAVSRSAVMTRYSRAMSCAVASTWPSGGRRTITVRRAVADTVGQVGLAAGDELPGQRAVEQRRRLVVEPPAQRGEVEARRVVGHASHTTRPDGDAVGQPLHALGEPVEPHALADDGGDRALGHEPDQLLGGRPAPGPGRPGCRGPSAGRRSSSSSPARGRARATGSSPPAKPTTTIRPSNATHLVERVVGVAADRVEDDVGAAAAGHRLDHRDEVLASRRSTTTSAPQLPRRPRPSPRRRRRRSPARPAPCRAGRRRCPTPPAAACTSSGLARLQRAPARCRPNQPVW